MGSKEKVVALIVVAGVVAVGWLGWNIYDYATSVKPAEVPPATNQSPLPVPDAQGQNEASPYEDPITHDLVGTLEKDKCVTIGKLAIGQNMYRAREALGVPIGDHSAVFVFIDGDGSQKVLTLQDVSTMDLVHDGDQLCTVVRR